MLAALAARAGAVPTTPARLADDRAATEEGLGLALERADVVIIAGGVSVGPHDHVKPALAALGVEELLWGVALQPGKPTWFGTRGAQLVFGLPGNPVSAAVTFFLFVAPALAALQGAAEPLPPRERALLATEVRRSPSREQALRVRLEHDGDRTVATPTGPQPSHFITSLVGADALAFVPAGDGVLSVGDEVAVERLTL
jgi:molybdopterin molybdotransferase